MAPGIIAHEISHELMCYAVDSKIIAKCYFKIDYDESAGFIAHETPDKLIDSMIISFSPFMLIPISLSLYIIAIILQSSSSIYTLIGVIILYWFAFAIGSQAYPSHKDLDIVYNKCTEQIQNKNYFPLVYLPPIHIAYLFSSLSIWFTFMCSYMIYLFATFIVISM